MGTRVWPRVRSLVAGLESSLQENLKCYYYPFFMLVRFVKSCPE